ncbi:MAG: ATP-binding protein [Oceanicaulis sp.]
MSLPPQAADRVDRVVIRTEKDVALARRAVSRAMDQVSSRAIVKTRFVTAVSEIARNAFVHAGGGVLSVYADEATVYVVCADDGPGIADVEAAMRDGFSTANSLGRGLGGARRLAARFEIDSGPKGTTVRMASR